MAGDLHCHTKMSDGSLGIEEVIGAAKRQGLNYISITDHDTISGCSRAQIVGKRYGVNVVDGVELSAYDYKRKRSAHILVYMPKQPDRLEGICLQTTENRKKAANHMVNSVSALYPITIELIAKHAQGSKCIYRQHIMHALMDLGYTTTIFGDLYNELFSKTNGTCNFNVEYPDVRDIIHRAKEANGIIVLAHPGSYNSLELLDELSSEGLLDGVEYNHRKNTEEDKKKILEIANRDKLILTGGSDFHGMYSSCIVPIGCEITEDDQIKKLFSLRDSIYRKLK